MTTNRSKAKAATLDDVLGAVQNVGVEVSHIKVKVDGLEKRVDKLEAAGPQLKTRIVNSYTKPQAARQEPRQLTIQPATKPRQDDDQGEDEAIAAGKWIKEVRAKVCNKIGITKTSKRDAWKLLLYMPGLRRPATFIAWDGVGDLLDFFAEVLPGLSMDYFDEEAWREIDDGRDRKTPILSWVEDFDPFLVEWFKTAPNTHGHTFINIEAVYPVAE